MTFKNTLVTGGTGLVGKALQELIPEAKFVSSKDYNLQDLKQTHKMFDDHKPSSVIHLAGKVGGLKANSEFLGDFFEENILINTNVLKCAKDFEVPNLVSFLSTCIFPAQVKYPLSENMLHEGEPHYTNFAYAYAKRMLEVQTRAYNRQHGLLYNCVTPTNIYGKHDNFNLQTSHVVPALIHKCYLAKRDNTPFVVWGSGKPLREFIYAKDVAQLALWALHHPEHSNMILSTGTEVSIKELVFEIVKAMDFKGDVIFDTTKPDGQFRKPTRSTLTELLPDFKFTSLEKGIKETVDWFSAEYENCKK
tara:strand:- start:1094 stop:2011 length:918 start_codon:yes stop_codon:yes gene_type:complete